MRKAGCSIQLLNSRRLVKSQYDISDLARMHMLNNRFASEQAQEFAKVMQPLFRQIARCLNSSHFQVRLLHDGSTQTAKQRIFAWPYCCLPRLCSPLS